MKEVIADGDIVYAGPSDYAEAVFLAFVRFFSSDDSKSRDEFTTITPQGKYWDDPSIGSRVEIR